MRKVILAAVLAAAIPLFAQRTKFEVNTETPEGKMLAEIGAESDPAKKIALADKFLAEHPTHEGAPWLWGQMQPVYIQAGQFDKAMTAAEKVVAVDPDALEVSYQALKAAEGKKDAKAIILWSGKTSDIAKKIAASPQPAEADAVEDWKKRVDYAKQVDTYTEYSLSASALQSTSNPDTVALVDALIQRNPKSQYIPQVTTKYIAAVQGSAPDKLGAAADRLSALDPNNEDVLLVVANSAMTSKQMDKAIASATRLTEMLKDKPKPENYSDADWEKRKGVLLGRGYWIAGMGYATQNKLSQADQTLRAALPHLKGDDALMQTALFNLGLANYKMAQGGKKALAADAVRFNDQAAAMRGPYTAQAAKNAKVIRTEFGLK